MKHYRRLYNDREANEQRASRRRGEPNRAKAENVEISSTATVAYEKKRCNDMLNMALTHLAVSSLKVNTSKLRKCQVKPAGLLLCPTWKSKFESFMFESFIGNDLLLN